MHSVAHSRRAIPATASAQPQPSITWSSVVPSGSGRSNSSASPPNTHSEATEIAIRQRYVQDCFSERIGSAAASGGIPEAVADGSCASAAAAGDGSMQTELHARVAFKDTDMGGLYY